MVTNGKNTQSLKLTPEQVAVLRRVVDERFDTREHFPRALEKAAGHLGYSNSQLFPVNYDHHLMGRPVTLRPARVYLDVLGPDSRLDFLLSLVDDKVLAGR